MTMSVHNKLFQVTLHLSYKGIIWSLWCSFLLVPYNLDFVCCRKGKIMVPSSYTALSGDLHIQLQYDELTSSDYFMEVSKLNNTERKLLESIRFIPDPRYNVTQISIGCRNFVQGGIYELVVIDSDKNTLYDNRAYEHLKYKFEVKWPIPKLSVNPVEIGTYPEEPVSVVLTFPELKCDIQNLMENEGADFWLELLYCGQNVTCHNSNETNSHILYAEQVRGFQSKTLFKLGCELFGLAGHYIVQLRSTSHLLSSVSANSIIRADWNEKFVFNVHARSIFPCDSHVGVGVLFEYPTCILDQADRIRIFARLRADVASLKPPTSLHYITERRIVRGQHSLQFDCDLFSEKFIEYCFAYVSQAISGAVADIRVDCVPTLPVNDLDSGGWGPWSKWTPCSTTCFGGTRNRYRFCDSPPPRYGAKFCEGSAVETEYCGQNKSDAWECLTPVKISRNTNNVFDEMRAGCRCGCIIRLGITKSKQLLASSGQSCPGRSFWLIKTDRNKQVSLQMDFIRLTCPVQYVKIRDGDALTSDLIAEYSNHRRTQTHTAISTSSKLLLEFFSDENSASLDSSCNGRFLAQIDVVNQSVTTSMRNGIRVNVVSKNITSVHIAVLVFAAIITTVSALLGIQYIIRYWKYHLTRNIGEYNSPAHTPRTSVKSLHESENAPSRAISTTTLLSEVIYLVKIRPRARVKHSILRESIISKILPKPNGLNFCKEDKTISMDSESIGSTHTLTEQSIGVSNISVQNTQNEHKISNNNSGNFKMISRTSPIGLHTKDNALSVSSITLTNGCFSPAVSSVSTANIRSTTNQKESKDKQNRQKLLARPDSEFSLANPEDLELDYYDYNVVNAGAAPGSYLGMDPAYLVWIPPLDNGSILNEISRESEIYYEDIPPYCDNLDPGNNRATPFSEIPKSSATLVSRNMYNDNDLIKNNLLQHFLKSGVRKDVSTEICSERNNGSLNEMLLNEFTKKKETFTKPKEYCRIKLDTEKETSVVKSSICNNRDYYELELDDIKFADDDLDNESDNKKKIIKYAANQSID